MKLFPFPFVLILNTNNRAIIGGLQMFWLILLSPFIIFMPFVIYFNNRNSSNDPEQYIEKHLAEADQIKRDHYFTTAGGNN